MDALRGMAGSGGWRHLLLLAALLMFTLLAGAEPQAVPGGGPGPSGPTAIFPDGHLFHLEIARSPEERALGYMYRDQVGPEEGMLFLFPRDDFHSFWMKNCRVSLDLVWLSLDLIVVHLEKKVPPCRRDPCPGYPPLRKARFVLEVRGGMAEKSGLRVGDSVRVDGIDSSLPTPP